MKKGFLDGYKTYDTSNGFGNATEWKNAFNERMGREEALSHLDNEDPHVILGVGISATKDEIKSAYRKLAKKWHPDLNKDPNAEKMMKKIIAAYSLLS